MEVLFAPDWRDGVPYQRLLAEALDEAIGIRKKILELAGEGTYAAQREKERLLAGTGTRLNAASLSQQLPCARPPGPRRTNAGPRRDAWR